MQLSILKKFVTIARLGNFTRAANELNVAQPALSKQMKRLENELETTLFVRKGRGIMPTKAGRNLLQHSQQILEEWGKAQKAIKKTMKRDKGFCKIAMFPTFIMFIAPNFLVDFIHTHPLIDLEIEQSMNEFPNETIIQWVLGHQFEAGIAMLPVTHPRLHEFPLYIEESVLIVGKNHSLYGQNEIQTSQIGEYPLIVTSLNINYREFLSRAFQNPDTQLQVKHVVHHYPIVFQMVRAGIGAGIVPKAALKHLDKNDKSLGVIHFSPRLQRQIGWIEHRGAVRSPATEAFFQFLTSYLKKQQLVECLIKPNFDK